MGDNPSKTSENKRIFAPITRYEGNVLSARARGGYILVIQTHGRNGHYNQHLHIIAISGGWDAQGQQWVHLGSVPYPLLRKKWQWYALEMCRETLQD